MRRDIERLDGPEAIPTTRERNDIGKIALSLGDRTFELLGPTQPIPGVFNTGRPGGSAPERVGGPAGTKLESTAPNRQKSGHLFQKPAARRRKNPSRNLAIGLTSRFVVLNEALELAFQRSIGRSRIRFSDNPSELLSAFRHAREVSARF